MAFTDRNATSKVRIRRNSQRAAVVDYAAHIKLKSTGGLVASATGLAIKLDGTSLALSASGLKLDVITTKGDILTYASAPARLPVGTDGQVLIADSSQSTGLKWGAASSSSSTPNAITWGGPWNTAYAYVSDTFTHANSSSFIGTAPTGQTWSNDSGTWGVISNTAYCSATSAEPGSNSNASIESRVSDCVVNVTISTVSTGNGLIVRADNANPGLNHVLIYSDGSTIQIFEKLGIGSYTALTTFPGTITYTPTNGDVLSVSMSGTFLNVFVNSVSVGTASSTRYTTNTRHGLYSDNTTVRYDNFSVTHIPGTYVPNEIVTYSGGLYINILGTTSANNPSNATYWIQLA